MFVKGLFSEVFLTNDMLQKAKALIAEKKFAPALQTLKDFLASNCLHEEANILFLALAIDLRVYDLASAQALSVYETLKVSLSFQLLLGRLYFHLGQKESASKHLLLGYALNPQIKANYELAKFYHQKMSFEVPLIKSDIVFVTGGYFMPQNFNGATLDSQALGGSESAVISVAKYWVKKGRSVVVYCNCKDPGIYDGVTYRPNWEFYYAYYGREIPLLIAARYDEYLIPPIKADKKILWLHDVPQTRLYAHLRQDNFYAEKVICLSDYHIKMWIKHLLFDEQIVFKTRNGFDPAFFSDLPLKPENEIIYATRPSRGLDAAIAIFEKLYEQNNQLKLKICTYSQEINLADDREYAPYLKYQNRPGVLFLGALPKKEFILELSKSLFMLYPNTSEPETSCISAIESMAAGCPVITSDRGALSETVRDGIGGIVIPCSADPEKHKADFVERGSELMNDPKKLLSLRQTCKKFAWSHYQWADIVSEWDEHFFKKV
ncbi:MAG: glycosyl transferase group 1 [uncultured bacterium]|nr:MAG: glycosyl transferase group 1 [uncultured bacterium]